MIRTTHREHTAAPRRTRRIGVLLAAFVALASSACMVAPEGDDTIIPDDLNKTLATTGSKPNAQEIANLRRAFNNTLEEPIGCFEFCAIVCSLGQVGECFCDGQSFDCGNTGHDECPRDALPR